MNATDLAQRFNARRSGSGYIAKCPAHEDRKPSLSIREGSDGRALIKCHAGCSIDEVLAASGLTKRDLFPAQSTHRQSGNGKHPTPAFDWRACVNKFTDKHLERLAEWRGYSEGFTEWLRDNALVGLCEGQLAFPVHDNGKVVAAHVRTKNGAWHYTPKGTKTRPLLIGDVQSGDPVHVFESQWDAFAFMDVSGERSGLVITRGASNGASIAGAIPERATVYLWPQNDVAGEKWAKDICAHADGATVKRARIPALHKDLNDFTLAGAADRDLLDAMSSAETVREAERPSLDHVDDAAEVDDFPEPPSEASFHGLAGDIVRRIEPHSEAHGAALLIQIITAFGNVIGANAHAVADGSRHAMNLFAVLVGETSKARKGTSWNHTLRVFDRADEQWKQNCVGHGLSSGEGVIWAVRDPISKIVKGKTEIVDAGVSDKRLCVAEGEFANVLKVMAREGNTLSPVIRAAWDSGNLRSMTKNSEARATGAHVSIVGHITKDELRRLLTETESANGFANRFLFLAVRRSKCLPEGGQIDAENLNDLVMRLHDAIEFCRDAGEVTRDERTRDLWRACYPELSEGKPGLPGAITARAEAQVLRLSCVYALLDCSTTISVDHHRAALALWNYCERSAKWIFGTAAGDARAEQILIALRAAGAGMTRKQILDVVFQRNVTGDVLTASLQSLQRSGLADCRKETTGGKPREVWFVKRENSK